MCVFICCEVGINKNYIFDIFRFHVGLRSLVMFNYLQEIFVTSLFT